MILRSRIFHSNVVEARIEHLDNRVEVLIKNLIGDREVVNKHRIYAKLKSFNIDSSLGSLDLIGSSVIRFREPVECLNIVIELDVQKELSYPSASILLRKCTEIRYSKQVDELFNRA